MKRGPSALLRNITNRLASRRGNSTLIFGLVVLAVIYVLFLMLFQRWELDLLAGDVSKDITAALTSAAGNQLYNSYQPLRDGTSGSYVYNGRRFEEIRDTRAFQELFTEMYRECRRQGDSLVKLRNGKTVFVISNIRLSVSNASDDAVTSIYRIQYDLELENNLLWSGSATVIRDQEQTVEYMNRF